MGFYVWKCGFLLFSGVHSGEMEINASQKSLWMNLEIFYEELRLAL